MRSAASGNEALDKTKKKQAHLAPETVHKEAGEGDCVDCSARASACRLACVGDLGVQQNNGKARRGGKGRDRNHITHRHTHDLRDKVNKRNPSQLERWRQ